MVYRVGKKKEYDLTRNPEERCMKIFELVINPPNSYFRAQLIHSRFKCHVNYWACPVLLMFVLSLTACGGGNSGTGCPPAFEDTGTGCEFAGAPADPGFQAADVWSTTNTTRVVLDPNDAGNLDTGLASLTPDGVCVFDSIFQTFAMPSLDRSEIFAVDVNYFTEIGGSRSFDSLGPAILINGGWNTLPQQQFGFAIGTFCLGEGGYGGDVEFRINAANESVSCDATPSSFLRFDRFAVRRALAGECPDDVGVTINGDMEGSNGWTFAVASGGTAAYLDNNGVGDSRGIRITRTTTASSASATSRISLPLDTTVPNSAIEFFTNGTSRLSFHSNTKDLSCSPVWLLTKISTRPLPLISAASRVRKLSVFWPENVATFLNRPASRRPTKTLFLEA